MKLLAKARVSMGWQITTASSTVNAENWQVAVHINLDNLTTRFVPPEPNAAYYTSSHILVIENRQLDAHCELDNLERECL